MTIYDNKNGRGRFQTTYFVFFAGTGSEIGDPRLWKQVVHFGGRFSLRTRKADNTGWAPYPRRAEGRFRTRFRISLPFLRAVLEFCAKHSQKRAATRSFTGTVELPRFYCA
jgi:hypothetical protein